MNKNLSKITLSQSNIVKKLKKKKKIHQTVANKILCDYKINVSRIIFGTTDREQFKPIFSTQVKKTNKQKTLHYFINGSAEFRQSTSKFGSSQPPRLSYPIL